MDGYQISGTDLTFPSLARQLNQSRCVPLCPAVVNSVNHNNPHNRILDLNLDYNPVSPVDSQDSLGQVMVPPLHSARQLFRNGLLEVTLGLCGQGSQKMLAFILGLE